MGIMYSVRSGYGFQLGLKDQNLVPAEAWQKFLDEVGPGPESQPMLPLYTTSDALEYLRELFDDLSYFDYFETQDWEGNYTFVAFFKDHYKSYSFGSGGDDGDDFTVLESPGSMDGLASYFKREFDALSEWFHVYADEPEVITMVEAN